MANRSVEYRKNQWIKACAKHHKNKRFDYSLVEYIDTDTDVEIVCENGHHFFQTPRTHRTRGCPICKAEKSKNLIFGAGVNDTLNESHDAIYIIWHSMLRRCYSKVYKKLFDTYEGCEIAEEWQTFSNFKNWVINPENGYRKGYHLDKDILVKGNKTYSPEKCCFVPRDLNMLLTKRQKSRGEFPIGVSRYKGRYSSSLRYEGKSHHLGYYDTPEEAFLAYKIAKENRIKEVAQEYYDRGEITEKVYKALMAYEVEITD